MFEVYRLVQAFGPSFAAQYIDAAWVDAFTTIPPLAGHVAALKRELPAYLSKCAGTAFSVSGSYTQIFSLTALSGRQIFEKLCALAAARAGKF